MLKELTAATVALILGAGIALADSGKDGPDDNNGGGNEPHAPGQTTNPNPGKLFDDGPPVWLDEFVVAVDDNGDKHGQDAPSGPQGPGQHDGPGPNGNSGP